MKKRLNKAFFFLFIGIMFKLENKMPFYEPAQDHWFNAYVWFTGKCVVITTLKAGTVFLQSLYKNAPNKERWLGANFSFRFVNYLDNNQDSHNTIRFVSQPGVIYSEDTLKKLLKYNTSIPIIGLTRKNDTKIYSGITEALSHMDNLESSISQFKSEYEEQYRLIDIHIKRNITLFSDPNFNDRNKLSDYIKDLVPKSRREPIFKDKNFVELLSFFLEYYINKNYIGLFRDRHVTVRTNLLLFKLMTWRTNNSVSNDNFHLVNLDYISQNKNLQEFMKKYDLVENNFKNYTHSKSSLRKVVENLALSLADGPKFSLEERIYNEISDYNILYSQYRHNFVTNKK